MFSADVLASRWFPLLSILALAACGDKKPPAAPAPEAPVALSAIAMTEGAATRIAAERGYLVHDPHAAATDLGAIVWLHAGIAVRPLTGAVVVLAEDLRVPLGGADLVLARSFAPTLSDKPPAWDEHFGLGPASPRCAAGAACDPEGRVHAWQEGDVVVAVAWEGAHPRSLSVGGHAFADFRYEAAGLVALRAAPITTTAAPEAWPWRVGYTRDDAGRIAAVDTGGVAMRYAYDGRGRLVEVARGRSVTRLGYDEADRVTLLEGPAGLTTRLAYAPAAGTRREVTVTNALGEATRFSWSPTGDHGDTSEVRAEGARPLLWRFDAAGRLLVHEAAGATTRFTWDEAGRLVEARYPDGLGQRLERAPDGKLARIVEGPRTVAFTFGARGEIASLGVSDEDRETWTWSADDPPRLLRIDHASGRVESFARDALGRVVRIDDGAGAASELRYDERTGQLGVRRDDSGEDTYEHDAAGRPIQHRRPDGAVETWRWDDLGRLAAYTSPGGAASAYEYDDAGRLVKIARAGGEVAWTYDALGRPLSETSPLGTTRFGWRGPDLVNIELPSGAVVVREHDAQGRLVREEGSDGVRRELVWAASEAGGRLLREVVPGVIERRFTWDEMGRPARLEETGPVPGARRDLRFAHRDDGTLEVREALSGASWTYRRAPGGGAVLLSSAATLTGAAESYTYDARGRLREKVSSLGGGFTLSWDPLGRPSASTSPASGTTRLGWTADGQLASLASELGPERRFERDAAGRLVVVTEGARRWSLAYAGADLGELVDPAGRRTTFTWDERHRLTSLTSPASGTIRYAYDDAGRIASETRADGSVHAFSWDAAGRLARHDVDGAPVRTLTWDERGRVVADEGPEHALRFAFDDAAGRRTTRDERAQVTTTRTRDALGRTQALDVDGHLHARYLWRSDGLLGRVEGPAGFAVELDHDAFGRRTGLRLPGGGTLAYHYDGARRLVGLEVAGKDGPTFAASFAYDAAGRLGAMTSAGRSLGYAYDAAGRLASLTLPDGSRRDYAWSDAGELVRIGGVEISQDAAGRPVAEGRGYDALGRLASGPGGQALVHDRMGRLARVERAGSVIAYRYDGDGRLRARGDGAAESAFVWDGQDLLEARDPGGATLQQIPGEQAGERFGFVASGVPRYLVQGPDGSTLAVVDGEGRVLMTYLHEPFGATLAADGAAPDPLHYRGRFADPATGLVYFPMRWYDPRVGAFIAPDPEAGDAMEPASLHRYAYLGGDPVNHVDPLGAQGYEWGPGQCLEAVCKLFQQGKIPAQAATRLPADVTYFGAIEKGGWTYDVWSKRVPGTDRILTIFRDLNERAEGPFQGAGLSQNIVMNPDGPRNLQPVVSATPAAPNSPGYISTIRSTVSQGVEQIKLGVQLYGKEISGTVAGLGGVSGTLGTSLGTIASLPGGGTIIAISVAVAGAAGYGTGTVINKVPGVSDATQAFINKLMGYDKDQAIADLKAQMENEGSKAKEHRDKTIADNLAKDTLPPPPEPGVAGGPANIGEPPRRDRDRPHVDADAEGPPDTGPIDDDDADDDDDDDDAATAPEADAVVPDILKLVAPRQISVTFTHEEDASAGEFKNIVRCTEHLTFWNVGAMAPGYGAATQKGVCVASLNGAESESSGSGTFSGGPNGTLTFSSEGTSVQVKVRGGSSISIPGIGERSLPAGAFADWPKGIP